MKFKKILVTTVLIASVFAMIGCGEDAKTNETLVNKDNNVESEVIDENKSSEDNDSSKAQTVADNGSNKSEAKTNTGSKKSESNVSKASANTDKAAENNSLFYKSKLGFSISFPSNWKDRYKIKEDDNSMKVYFKSTDPSTPENSGLLFIVIKNCSEEESSMLDSFMSDGSKEITVANTKYTIGGPTDIGLSDQNKDFNLYRTMRKECEKAVRTMKAL